MRKRNTNVVDLETFKRELKEQEDAWWEEQSDRAIAAVDAFVQSTCDIHRGPLSMCLLDAACNLESEMQDDDKARTEMLRQVEEHFFHKRIPAPGHEPPTAA
jgi:hypothetical protein